MLSSIEQTKDIGQVKFGQPTSFSFNVTNSGPNPLEITKVAVGCQSCTKASVLDKRLQPGASTEVNVIFTPGSLGKQNKFINVEWDRRDTLRLTFTAESYE